MNKILPMKVRQAISKWTRWKWIDIQKAHALRRIKGDDIANHAHWVNHYAGWTPEFRNRYAGEDAVLLCNGPSLNNIDLELLHGKHVIGLNKIHFLLERIPLKLCYHVAVNTLVIEQSWQDFAKLGCPSFVSWTKYPQILGLPSKCHLVTTSVEKFPPYFATDPLREPLHESWTVTFVALQLAYFMGFKRVFITGMDHNFKCSGNPNEEQKLSGADENHFDPRYFSEKNWQLPDLEGSEIGYRLAKFVWERTGRSIIDATEGGKCNIFPKMDYEEAMKLCENARSENVG
jgi:hypothetical protein